MFYTEYFFIKCAYYKNSVEGLATLFQKFKKLKNQGQDKSPSPRYQQLDLPQDRPQPQRYQQQNQPQIAPQGYRPQNQPQVMPQGYRQQNQPQVMPQEYRQQNQPQVMPQEYRQQNQQVVQQQNPQVVQQQNQQVVQQQNPQIIQIHRITNNHPGFKKFRESNPFYKSFQDLIKISPQYKDFQFPEQVSEARWGRLCSLLLSKLYAIDITDKDTNLFLDLVTKEKESSWNNYQILYTFNTNPILKKKLDNILISNKEMDSFKILEPHLEFFSKAHPNNIRELNDLKNNIKKISGNIQNLNNIIEKDGKTLKKDIILQKEIDNTYFTLRMCIANYHDQLKNGKQIKKLIDKIKENSDVNYLDFIHELYKNPEGKEAILEIIGSELSKDFEKIFQYSNQTPRYENSYREDQRSSYSFNQLVTIALQYTQPGYKGIIESLKIWEKKFEADPDSFLKRNHARFGGITLWQSIFDDFLTKSRQADAQGNVSNNVFYNINAYNTHPKFKHLLQNYMENEPLGAYIKAIAPHLENFAKIDPFEIIEFNSIKDDIKQISYELQSPKGKENVSQEQLKGLYYKLNRMTNKYYYQIDKTKQIEVLLDNMNQDSRVNYIYAMNQFKKTTEGNAIMKAIIGDSFNDFERIYEYSQQIPEYQKKNLLKVMIEVENQENQEKKRDKDIKELIEKTAKIINIHKKRLESKGKNISSEEYDFYMENASLIEKRQLRKLYAELDLCISRRFRDKKVIMNRTNLDHIPLENLKQAIKEDIIKKNSAPEGTYPEDETLMYKMRAIEGGYIHCINETYKIEYGKKVISEILGKDNIKNFEIIYEYSKDFKDLDLQVNELYEKCLNPPKGKDEKITFKKELSTLYKDLSYEIISRTYRDIDIDRIKAVETYKMNRLLSPMSAIEEFKNTPAGEKVIAGLMGNNVFKKFVIIFDKTKEEMEQDRKDYVAPIDKDLLNQAAPIDENLLNQADPTNKNKDLFNRVVPINKNLLYQAVPREKNFINQVVPRNENLINHKDLINQADPTNKNKDLFNRVVPINKNLLYQAVPREKNFINQVVPREKNFINQVVPRNENLINHKDLINQADPTNKNLINHKDLINQAVPTNKNLINYKDLINQADPTNKNLINHKDLINQAVPREKNFINQAVQRDENLIKNKDLFNQIVPINKNKDFLYQAAPNPIVPKNTINQNLNLTSYEDDLCFYLVKQVIRAVNQGGDTPNNRKRKELINLFRKKNENPIYLINEFNKNDLLKGFLDYIISRERLVNQFKYIELKLKAAERMQ
jgi:hypothetical protein